MEKLKTLLGKIFPLGTRTLLFGVHCVPIHFLFVAWAWIKLYGVPFHPLIWLSFLVHDIGYCGKAKIDDRDAEWHPMWGAYLLGLLGGKKWFYFSIGHSRYLSKLLGVEISRLCVADKYSIVLMPSWLYLFLGNLSGEIHEYIQHTKDKDGKYYGMNSYDDNQRTWLDNLKKYLTQWVEENKNIS